MKRNAVQGDDEALLMPKWLNSYSNEDFVVKLKVRFLFFLIVAYLITACFLFISTLFVQLFKSSFTSVKEPILIVIGILILFIAYSLRSLVKGRYRYVSHLILIGSFISTWLIMFFDTGSTINRLDTIVFVIAILATTPIIITSNKKSIVAYLLFNIVIFVIFLVYFHHANREPDSILLSYFIDTSISILFVGIVSYNVFHINDIALKKAHEDIHKRAEIEGLLIQSERKYREMTELLPQTVFESDLHGHLTYVNKHGFDQFGYNEDDLKEGFNLLQTIVLEDHERALKNIANIIDGKESGGHQYTAVRKNGTTFKVEIYTNVIFENNKPIGIRGVIVDMTERIEAERKLKESRDQYEALVNNIPGVTYRCLYNPEWTMIYMSSEMDQLSGYPSHDFIDNKVRTYGSVIYGPDQEMAFDKVREAINNDLPWEIEYRVVHKDGLLKWAYEKGKAIKNKNGEVDFLDGFILDISQRKKAEADLQLSEERYKYLFFKSPIALASVRNDGAILAHNDVLVATLGYNVENINTIEKWWINAYPDEKYRAKVLEQWKADIQAALLNKTDLVPREYNVTDFWGKEHTMLIGASLQDDTLLASFIDITERKKAEEKLAQSEERFKTLIDLLPYPVMLNDLQERFLLVNDAFCKEVQLTKDEIIGKTASEINYMVDKETQIKAAGNLAEFGFVENIEATVVNRSNIVSNIYFSSKIIKTEGKPYILSSTINVTEKKKIERELENYRINLENIVKERTDELAAANQELAAINDELKATNDELYNQREELEAALNELQDAQDKLIESEKMASLGILSSGIAHEINNPLNFIKGGAYAIANYFEDNLPDHQNEIEPLISAINTGVERATQIVTSLNHFSRRTESISEECDIHAILDHCLIMLTNSIKHQIDVEKNFTSQTFKLLGNDGKLHQVFLNILTNAVQAIDGKGLIKINTTVNEHFLRISIMDNGQGINSEHLARIFDPFFTTKAPGKGTGLGLSISYKIIREHNGQINVESQKNKGTTVVVDLPIILIN